MAIFRLTSLQKGMPRMPDHQPRVIEYSTVPTIKALLETEHPAIVHLVPPVMPLPNTPLLIPENATSDIIAQHFAAPSMTPLGIVALANVFVSGKSYVGTDRSTYLLAPAVPPWVDKFIKMRRLHLEVSLIDKIERSTNIALLLTHWNSNQYGHWILEGLLQMLLVRRLREQLPSLSIITPRWSAHEVIRWGNILLPSTPIVVYDEETEYIRCERLLIPTILCSGPFFHPLVNSLIDELRRLVDAERGGDDRIYITRPNPGTVRLLSNREEIENIAIANGLRLIAPETLPVGDQVRLFSGSRLIVGEYGSGMHNTLFSTDRALVLCLNYMDVCQSRLSQLRRYRVGYVLPSNGQPVIWQEGVGLREFHVDPTQFARALMVMDKIAQCR
jgi:glycosyl transferase family 61